MKKNVVRARSKTDAISIPKVRESLMYSMNKEAKRLGITLEEACVRAFISFCAKG